MLERTLEFLRVADLQPNDEKIRKRRECAEELLTHLGSEENHAMLLELLQGVVVGFDRPPLSKESGSVSFLIRSIKNRDATLPHDLTENATELRAVAAIAVGELLTNHPEGSPVDDAVLAALALLSALSSRPNARNKHIRWMLGTLAAASGGVVVAAAHRRRESANGALLKLARLEKPAEDVDVWDTLMPVVKDAVREVSAQDAVAREEVETLWWMFGAHSEIEGKALAELSPSAAAFCSGIELAQRALLPPSPNAVAMVRRAVESGRTEATLGALSLENAIADWSVTMLNTLSPASGETDSLLSARPALLPLSYACLRLRECKDAPRLGKDFATSTGIPLTYSQTAAQWGAQVFRESILQRFIIDTES
jgi:GTPase-associated system helical domain